MAVSVGIVGFGRMGARHLRALSSLPDTDVPWIVEPSAVEPLFDPTTGAGIPHFRELADVRDHPVDIVVVASPTSTHFDVASASLNLGRVVFVEKPLATTADQAAELVRAAAAEDVLLVTGHVERFNPAVGAVQGLLSGEKLGQPLALSFRRVGLAPPSALDSDVINDLAVHDFDVCSWLLGRPLSVIGVTSWPPKGPVEAAQILCESGQTGVQFQANWKTPVRIREFVVTTDQCLIEVNYATQSVEIVEPDVEADFERFSGLQAYSAKRTKLDIRMTEPLLAQAQALVRLALGDRDERMATGEDGLRVARMVDAAKCLSAAR